MLHKNLFLIFSHRLTPEQIQDAQENLQIEHFEYLPENLQELWSNVPPDLASLSEHLKPILLWLEQNTRKDDFVLIQGDFWATILVVQWCWEHNLIPIYSTTTRISTERREKDGSIRTERIFVHKRYRLYERI